MTMLRVVSAVLAGGIRITVWRDALHLRFDPGFGSLIDFGLAHAGRVEGRTDADGDLAGRFQESLAWPEFAGVMGNGNDLAATWVAR